VMRQAGVLARGALTLSIASCASQAPSSSVTSIRMDDCSEAPADIQARFEASSLGVQQCDGAFGWRVFVVSSDTSTWIELRAGTAAWSSEEAIVYEKPIGLFPGVRGETLEWRADDRRRPSALLFTVAAQSPEDAATPVSRVFVARFDARGGLCVIGREPTIDKARALADGPATCPPS
jgi:hypothetical protein